MALDTKYRPLKYADVLGQDATAQMLKEIVRKGRGFHQSYVFGGGHGSGKTTLGRILARALLCENPQEGEPCDECKSCKAMLAGRSEVFIEIDAATNSGKDDVRRVTEDASFGSFSGKRKIYLWDESHELSRQAMDAMLKPMEDNVAGTENKQLVCIFCTTEPEKMRSAIMSRCAPAFRIRTNKPADIAKRLAYICDQEKITYESEALVLVSEFAETHIRDAIKAVEGVSMLGDVTKAAVEKYLNIAANQNYLEILEGIGRDLSGALSALDRALQDNSAATCYRRLADLAMMAYRLVVIGSADVPSYWDKDRVRTMGELHNEYLVEFADRLSKRPYRATRSMLQCDVAAMHQFRAGVKLQVQSSISSAELPSPPPVSVKTDPVSTEPVVEKVTGIVEAAPTPIEPSPKTIEEKDPETEQNAGQPVKAPEEVGTVSHDPVVTNMGVFLDPVAQNTRRSTEGVVTTSRDSTDMSSNEFTKVLRRRVLELTEEKATSGRPARRNNLGSS